MSTNKIKSLVSLGMSCQTTHQLRRLVQSHAEAQSQQAKSTPASTMIDTPPGPFDWLLINPACTIDLLDDRIPDFTRESIQIHKGRAYWPDFDVYLWHNFLINDGQNREVNIDATFEQEISRWAYLRSRFEALEPADTVFVVSNTQNNLATEVFDESERDQYQFYIAVLDELQQSLARYFDTTTNNIHLEVVTRPELSSGFEETSRVTFLPLDKNEWKGSKKSWDNWWQQLEIA